MNKREAQTLKVGDRVMWGDDHQDGGTIKEVARNSVYILWDNGQKGYIHYQDMSRVSLLKG